MNKAIFLDRDGTIIVDKHYMHKPQEIEYIEGAIEALKLFQELGYDLYIITNQSGIGRGYFIESEMHLVHKKIKEQLSEHDISIKGIAHCPHTAEDKCTCRKPSPELVNNFVKADDIDSSLSYMVGDKPSDVKSGENANMKGILLTEDPDGVVEFKTLLDFAKSLEN